MKVKKKTKKQIKIKWVKPAIKTISFQEMQSVIIASACSQYGEMPCRLNFR